MRVVLACLLMAGCRSNVAGIEWETHASGRVMLISEPCKVKCQETP